MVARAAELHDIGKIAIPDAILRKPGVLDAGEWELMRRHTLIGERILGAAPALRPVAAIVRSSHERWDGAATPMAWRARQIPLGSRIIFVCDAFDAMTSERPYRDAGGRVKKRSPSYDETRALNSIRRSSRPSAGFNMNATSATEPSERKAPERDRGRSRRRSECQSHRPHVLQRQGTGAIAFAA